MTSAALQAVFVVPWVLFDATLENAASALLAAAGFGAAALAGAALAWLLVHCQMRSRWIGRTSAAGLVPLGIAGGWLRVKQQKDRSCHNTLRDGRKSISPVAEFALRAPMEQWPELERELFAFARENGWQTRSDIRPDPGFPWFQFNLCHEPGTNIFIMHGASEAGSMRVHVFSRKAGPAGSGRSAP